MKRKVFWAFTLPSVGIMALLMVLPLVTAVYLSLHQVLLRDLSMQQWVGLGNYWETLLDPAFWASVRFTLIFVALTVPVQMVLGLGIALMLDRVGRGRAIYLAALLLPFIVTPVVGTLVYRDLFTRGGLLAFLIEQVTGEAFILTATNVKWLIIVQAIWHVTPFALVTYFAGLQTLPEEQMEAAEIDGASFGQSLRYVVLPHLSSLTVFISLISIMDAYRVFDSVFVFAGARFPDAHTLQVYNFQVALSSSIGRVGKGHAIAVLTVAGIFIVLIPFLKRMWDAQLADR